MQPPATSEPSEPLGSVLCVRFGSWIVPGSLSADLWASEGRPLMGCRGGPRAARIGVQGAAEARICTRREGACASGPRPPPVPRAVSAPRVAALSQPLLAARLAFAGCGAPTPLSDQWPQRHARCSLRAHLSAVLPDLRSQPGNSGGEHHTWCRIRPASSFSSLLI